MSYRFIDTHCHFDFPPFTGDESASIQRAVEVGVQSIIVPATQAANFPRVLALAENYPPLFAALGLHPIVIEQHSDDCLDQLQQELDKRPRKLVALGEIGLDLYRDDPQFDKQEWVLEAQLKLAKRYELPVILHSRRTHDKLAMHLKRHALPRTGVCMVFPGACSRQSALCNWDTKLAWEAPLPIRAPVNPRGNGAITAGIAVAGNRRAGYAAQWLSGTA